MIDPTKPVKIVTCEANSDDDEHEHPMEYVGYLRHSDSSMFFCPTCDSYIRVDWLVYGVRKGDR
jgi:hypothetical protein